jgi:hypothetical protein
LVEYSADQAAVVTTQCPAVETAATRGTKPHLRGVSVAD